MMVIGAPARRLAKIADANFAIRFAICTSDYTTQHYVSQTSAKTWSQWAAIQERIGLNSGWLPGEQRTALAAPLGLTVRSHLTDNSAASHDNRGRQIASSSRCRLFPSVTKIRHYLASI